MSGYPSQAMVPVNNVPERPSQAKQPKVYQIDFTAVASGKRIASTKRRVRWRFGFANTEALSQGQTGTACRGEEHDITLVWSITSGKRLILADGQEVHYSSSRAGIFDFSWTMRGNHVLKIVAHASPPISATPGFRQYDFFVDGQSFFSFPKVFRLGLAPNAPMQQGSLSQRSQGYSNYGGVGGNGGSTRSAGVATLEAPHNPDEEEAYLQEAIKNSLQEATAPAAAPQVMSAGAQDLLLDFADSSSVATPGPLALPAPSDAYGGQPGYPSQPAYGGQPYGAPAPAAPQYAAAPAQPSYPSQTPAYGAAPLQIAADPWSAPAQTAPAPQPAAPYNPPAPAADPWGAAQAPAPYYGAAQAAAAPPQAPAPPQADPWGAPAPPATPQQQAPGYGAAPNFSSPQPPTEFATQAPQPTPASSLGFASPQANGYPMTPGYADQSPAPQQNYAAPPQQEYAQPPPNYAAPPQQNFAQPPPAQDFSQPPPQAAPADAPTFTLETPAPAAEPASSLADQMYAKFSNMGEFDLVSKNEPARENPFAAAPVGSNVSLADMKKQSSTQQSSKPIMRTPAAAPGQPGALVVSGQQQGNAWGQQAGYGQQPAAAPPQQQQQYNQQPMAYGQQPPAYGGMPNGQPPMQQQQQQQPPMQQPPAGPPPIQQQPFGQAYGAPNPYGGYGQQQY